MGEPDEKQTNQNPRILGLSTSQLADLSTDELTNNPTAIKMLLHYYRQLTDDNTRLKNDNNTLKTYVDAYGKQKSNTATGGILLGVSNVSIAFGVNLLTGTAPNVWPGVSSLAVGITMAISGIYFTFLKDRR
jgi:hypothetical protein